MGGHQNDRDLDLVLADADIVNDATIEVLHDRVDDALVRLHRECGHRTILV